VESDWFNVVDRYGIRLTTTCEKKLSIGVDSFPLANTISNTLVLQAMASAAAEYFSSTGC
jgi:hypothetical protein